VLFRSGQPVGNVWFSLSGSIYGENANLMFKIEGPKGRATVQVDARMIAGKWALRLLNVTFADQKRISLNTSAGDGGEGDAPTWPAAGSAAAKTSVEPPKVSPPASPGPDIQLDMPDLSSPEKAPADTKTRDLKPPAK
jgi:hypothetical protein